MKNVLQQINTQITQIQSLEAQVSKFPKTTKTNDRYKARILIRLAECFDCMAEIKIELLDQIESVPLASTNSATTTVDKV